MDEDADLNLTIPVTAIFDEFLCPICFNLFTSTHMTPCGHNFCEGNEIYVLISLNHSIIVSIVANSAFTQNVF